MILKFLSIFSYFDDDLLGQQQQRLVAPSAGRRATKQSALANLNRYVQIHSQEYLAMVQFWQTPSNRIMSHREVFQNCTDVWVSDFEIIIS